jgi:hypothetical protein
MTEPTRDSAARAAAVEFFGAPAIYRDLAEGARFRFPPPTVPDQLIDHSVVYTKRARGWYTRADVPGKRYRTGVRAAVIPVTD